MADAAPIPGKWRSVWGPAQYRIALTTFDQTPMFVVQSPSSPADDALVSRELLARDAVSAHARRSRALELGRAFDVRCHLEFGDEVQDAFERLTQRPRAVGSQPRAEARGRREELHRLYRAPGSLVRSLLPESVASLRLRRRTSCFEKGKAS
jgi:hypothetical protein